MCIFCDMLKANAPTFGDSEEFVCRLDVHPVSPGHILVIPRHHVDTLNDLLPSEWKDLQRVVKVMRAAWSFELPRRMKEEYERILEDPPTENARWFIERAMRHKRFGERPDGFNHIVNEGTAAGQTVMHLHWHIIPRYEGDVPDPSGGGRYVIPELGNYRTPRQ